VSAYPAGAVTFMMPRSKKLWSLETKNTLTRVPGQPASQRYHRHGGQSSNCFLPRVLAVTAPEMVMQRAHTHARDFREIFHP
jgi:hypothetical protein